jgi:hypothetical protein
MVHAFMAWFLYLMQLAYLGSLKLNYNLIAIIFIGSFILGVSCFAMYFLEKE